MGVSMHTALTFSFFLLLLRGVFIDKKSKQGKGSSTVERREEHERLVVEKESS